MGTNILKITEKNISDLLLSYNKIFVAYSGGVDSHVLLHLLHGFCQDKKKIKLTAVHVNHNISSKAKKWSEYCRKTCKKLQIKCITKSIATKINTDNYSLEEILRRLRYEIFAQILPKNACLLTAHHAYDQAETLLLQLFRGAGPRGLAAMPIKTKFAKGWLARPLLSFSREEILAYAHKYKLQWIEDESNEDIKFDRNLIRHNLLPLIKKRWPAIVTTLNRVSRHCAETNELLEMLAEKDLKNLVNRDNANILDVNLLKKLPLIQQKNILRFWLHKLCLPLPSEVKLIEVLRTVVNSRYDAMPIVKWFGAEIRRFRNNLYAMPPLEPFGSKMLSGKLKTLKTKIVREFKLDPKKIRIRFRGGGEKVKLFGRKGTRDLKKLMQEWNIPPWNRDKVPLVYYGKEIYCFECFLNYFRLE